MPVFIGLFGKHRDRGSFQVFKNESHRSFKNSTDSGVSGSITRGVMGVWGKEMGGDTGVV